MNPHDYASNSDLSLKRVKRESQSPPRNRSSIPFSTVGLPRYNQSKSTRTPLVIMSAGAVSRMSPTKTPQKSTTPVSVKALMILEAGIIGFLTFWIFSEYQYNIYFQIYVNTNILQHLTTYTIVLGLGIGLAGSAAAATLYRNLKHAKIRLGTIAFPKIKGTVEKVLSSIPTIDERLPSVTVKERQSTLPTPAAQVAPTSTATNSTAIVPVVPSVDQKKSA